MADRTITTDLIGRDRTSSAFNSAGRSAGHLGGVLGKVGSVMKAGIAGGAALAAGGIAFLASKVVQGVKDADNYNKLGLRTAAVIKSTGNQAHISVKGIQALGDELEGLSGVDAELVINSENVLATFTNIKNVGKNKIFDMATRSTLDMSEALGSDLQGAAIQVGKALNDPIKGVSALSKVGVTFTDKQKKVIEQLVKTGDTAGAQKVILGELNKEFGGQAAASGKTFEGAMTRARNAMDDVFQEIGQALLPKLAEIADSLAKKIPVAVQASKDAWKTFVDSFKGTKLDSSEVSQLGSELANLNRSLGGLGDTFSDTQDKAVTWQSVMGKVFDPSRFVAGLSDWADIFKDVGLMFEEMGAQIQLKALTLVINVQKAFGKLPGSWGKHWREMAAETQKDIDKIQGNVDRINTKKAQSRVDDVIKDLRRLGNQRPNPKVNADTSAAIRKLGLLTARLHRIPDEYVNVFINEVQRDNVTGGHHVGGLAKGGFAAKGVPVVVGDGGRPELFIPDSDGTVLPEVPKSGGGRPWGGGGGDIYYITVMGAGDRQLGDAVVKALKARPAGSEKIPAAAVGR